MPTNEKKEAKPAVENKISLTQPNANSAKSRRTRKRKVHSGPIRRSLRLEALRQKEQTEQEQSLTIDVEPISNSDSSAESLSVPLSALDLNDTVDTATTNEVTDPQIEITQTPIAIRHKTNVTNASNNCMEWTDILSESVRSKWNRNATPIRSAMKAKKRKITHSASGKMTSGKVNWGKVECRAFEQRSGVISDGVPQSKGPSLCLGRLLSETALDLEEFESARSENGVSILNRKERIARVKSFSPKDVARGALSKDQRATNVLTASREKTGCDCTSIYKMKKDELLRRLIFLDDGSFDEKTLRKLKKKELMTRICRVQFAKYGRYDVCCVDADCECVRNGIECQIDDDCCACGGHTVYNNHLTELNKGDTEDEVSVAPRKTDSLACGNPNGNTLRLSVMDHRGDPQKAHHAVLATAQDLFVAFKSKSAQMCISEWNRHYKEDRVDGDTETSVRCALNF